MAMCIDLSKAFDSVNHNTLCSKLESYGVRGNALNLLASYLEDRTQQVMENDDFGRPIISHKIGVSRGVPQGSILGPLLYIIYTNELSRISGEFTILYADDTTLIFSEESPHAMLTSVQGACEALDEYFSAHDLLINAQKTQCLFFGNRIENTLSFTYRNINIQSSERVSFLGVEIDQRLDWRAHVENVALNVSRYCYALRIISENVGFDAALSAYHAFIQSRIRYGLIFWGNSPEIERVVILQKKCIRSIFGMKPRDSCRNVFRDRKILTIISMYILDSFMFVHTNSDIFETYMNNHRYATRHKLNLLPEKCNYSYIQKNVNYVILKIYNSFPESVRALCKTEVKRLLTKYLLEGAYYSLNEFFSSSVEISTGI